MKKINFIAQSIIFLILVVITINSSYEIANVYADKDYCYDQVGDGHFCFEKEHRCEKAQKHDEIAESPCYKED